MSEEAGVSAFTHAFVRTTPFGVLAGVTLPTERLGFLPTDELLARLHADERVACADATGHRLVDFIGGRLPCQAALRELGVSGSPLLIGARGAPTLADASVSVSVSHKPTLALALVAFAREGTVGVDLEGGDGRERTIIAPKVLNDDELAAFQALEPAAQWPFVQRRFAIKEAVYKAIHPHVQRYVGFHEAHVNDHSGLVMMAPRAGEPTLRVEFAVEPLGEALVAFARCRVVAG